MKKLCALTVLMLPLVVGANTIGGYKLGMSNSEAAKIGLKDCRRERGFIVCSGTFAPPDKVLSNMLAFNEKTKRLEQVKVYMDYGSNDLEKVQKDMRLASCPKELDGTTPMLKGRWHTCHYPQGIRTVKSQHAVRPGQARHYIAVELEWEPGADKRFLAEERKRNKGADSLKNFQSGK